MFSGVARELLLCRHGGEGVGVLRQPARQIFNLACRELVLLDQFVHRLSSDLGVTTRSQTGKSGIKPLQRGLGRVHLTRTDHVGDVELAGAGRLDHSTEVTNVVA